MGIVIANNYGDILEANDAFLDMIGYTRDELKNGSIDWRAITPEEWLPLDERAIDQMAVDGIFSQYEKEYIHKDGRRVPISVAGARIVGTGDEQICYIADLSHIRESESRYRFLAEALPQIVMMKDKHRRVIYVNRHYQEYTGISSEDADDRWRDAIHPEDLPALEHAREADESYALEYRLRRKSDGAYRWHFVRTQRVPGDSGSARWLSVAMDIDDRKRAEESLRFIEKAGSLLSESLDLSTTLETLLDLVVPEFGDWATINMRDARGIKTIAMRHSDPAKADLVRSLTGTYYHNVAGDYSTPTVYRTGVPQLLENVGEDLLRNIVKPEYVAQLIAMGAGSLISLPIFAGGEVIGTFGVVSVGDRRRYTEADLVPLKELSRRAGSAIRNARMYEREHRVAETLQRAALPRSLPVIEGLSFDGYYRSGHDDASIGGDWYDAFTAADGRAIVSIGDVAGSGLAAAVTMGNMRQAIRCAAHIYAYPSLCWTLPIARCAASGPTSWRRRLWGPLTSRAGRSRTRRRGTCPPSCAPPTAASPSWRRAACRWATGGWRPEKASPPSSRPARRSCCIRMVWWNRRATSWTERHGFDRRSATS